MTLLQKIKLSLRITTNAFDSEITDLIKACVDDLKLDGVVADVVSETTTDPLIVRAITLYVKWNFGEPSNPDQLREMYEMQKTRLMCAEGYTDWSI